MGSGPHIPTEFFWENPSGSNKPHTLLTRDAHSLRPEMAYRELKILVKYILLLGQVDAKITTYLHTHYQGVGFTTFEGSWLDFALNLLKFTTLYHAQQVSFIFIFLHPFSAVFVYIV